MAALILTLTSVSCSTAPLRFLVGAGVGGALGVGGGALLSPNKESRDINALVFGAAGALVGGAAAAFLFKDPKPATQEMSLKERELGIYEDTKLYSIPPNSKLPAFVKERLAPVVIEESEEPDSVSEDGTLHEPHRSYRIQKPAELYSRPKKQVTN